MVVRVWRGRTRTANAERYESYLRDYDGYRRTPGYVASFLTRRPAPTAPEETEFVLTSLWASMEAIARYAGADTARPNLHDEDKALLTASEPAEHFFLAFTDGSLREANLQTRQVAAEAMIMSGAASASAR